MYIHKRFFAKSASVSLGAALLIIALCAPVSGQKAPDGAALYNKMCAKCHSALAKTRKPGRGASRIESAIRNNIGGMGSFRGHITKPEIKAIADALTSIPPPPGADGAELYSIYCASCHKSLEYSSIKGKPASAITKAIKNNTGGMGYQNVLPREAIEKIAVALNKQ